MKNGENKPKLVIVESPYAGNIEENIEYARACVRDCFDRGEYPFCSHLLYTQPGILNDTKSSERKLGMEAGFAWAKHAKLSAVYVDLGISKGMEAGIKQAELAGRFIEYRSLKEKEKSFLKSNKINKIKNKFLLICDELYYLLDPEIKRIGLEVFGDQKAFSVWLLQDNSYFKKMPILLLNSPVGRKRIINFLLQKEYGVFV